MLETRFLYILENTLLYHPSWASVAIGMVVGICTLIALQTLFLWSYGASLIREDIRLLSKRKETLGDLILMKDIQTELEKEIEQAMLKATFQG